MYRIKLASGAETDYQSIDELSDALQGGVVTAEALIYHQRADRWLSITNHPHYQIALSRAPAGARNDASKRQIISAIRPENRPDAAVPSTRVAPAEPKPAPARPSRKLAIPTPKKIETGSLLAYENVLEGVVVSKPNPSENGNGQSGMGTEMTAALPVRSAPEPKKPLAVPPPLPQLPDEVGRLELVDSIAPEPITTSRPSAATPQVDKLLEMLEPAAAPAGPILEAPPLKPEARIFDTTEAKVVAPVSAEAVPAKVLASEPLVAGQSRPRDPKIKVLGIAAGASLVILAGLFLWKPWGGTAGGGQDGTGAPASLPRTEAFGGSSSGPGGTAPTGAAPLVTTTDSAKVPVKPVDSAPSIVRVAAPRNMKIRAPQTDLLEIASSNQLSISAGTLIRNFNAAYTDARSELELRMLQIGFTQIFLRSRLATSSGVEDTRRLIASAGTALRQYRGQETQIERAYQDTIGVAGRNLGWTPRDLGTWNAKPEQKENAETLRLTNLVLSQMDSLFSLLSEQEGKFQVSGEVIIFQDSEATRQYGALRAWLNQQADKYAGSGDALPATLRQVVKAIGATRLPQERK